MRLGDPSASVAGQPTVPADRRFRRPGAGKAAWYGQEVRAIIDKSEYESTVPDIPHPTD